MLRLFKPATCACLLLAAACYVPHAALAQTPADASSRAKGAPAAAAAEASGHQHWTCAMHPQIRKAARGKCPICGMELIPLRDGADSIPQLPELREMLAVALQHHPDVRVARARLQAAEAELDRTRLEVLQQIVAYRERWEEQSAALRVAQTELRQAQRAAGAADTDHHPAAAAGLVATAKEKCALLRAKLSELQTELPLLLGRAAGRAAEEPTGAARKLIREKLLPKARQVVQLRTREYSTGNAGILEVVAAQRQLAELEALLATTNQQKIAAAESQQKLLQQTHKITEARYKSGEASQGDVLAVELEVAKLDLRLIQLRGE